MSANLILRWMLDTVNSDNTVSDSSSNHFNGTAAGNPTVIPDEKFGSCLSFDGVDDSLSLPAMDNLTLRAYTLSVWIRPAQVSGRSWMGIAGKPGRDYNIWLHSNGFIHHRFSTATDTNAGVPDTPNNSITWGEWQHVAITNDGQTACTYINGVLQTQTTLTGIVPHRTPLYVGRWLDEDTQHNGYYSGRMAHIRLYDGALTQDEIRTDMLNDEAALASFIQTHPLDFNFYNEDEHHVLYILDTPTGQTMYLDITNTSRQNITLNALSGAASPQNYHFALRFRPQTLAVASLDSIQLTTPGWSLYREPDLTALYLLRQGGGRVNAGEALSLTLTGMNADGRGGARGTRVELDYQQMSYEGGTTPLDSTRLAYMNILNHTGKRNIPLHFGFAGGDRIVADGSSVNKLRLRVANVERDFALNLSGKNASLPSKFILSVDIQDGNEVREWALTDIQKARSLKVAASSTNTAFQWDVTPPNFESLPLEWIITPRQDTKLGLASQGGTDLILAVDGIVAPLGLGHTNFYLDYENIPGYQDGQAVVTAEKTPLVFWQPDANAQPRVGIGIAEPQARLHVLNASQDANGNTLILGPTNGTNLRLGYHTDYSWIQAHGGKPLAINPIGNGVAIGKTTPNPGYTLDVNGHTNVNGGLTVKTNITQTGFDFVVGINDSSRGDTGPSRALVKDHNATLVINYAGDYKGGVRIDGPVVHVAALKIGNVTIGENELRILQKLTSGELVVDLWNTEHREYLYAASDGFAYDNDRRRVFTWRKKNERVTQGYWRLSFPR